ncbi:low-density lipoprotein receptor-related protein 4-like [Haliotis rubra]|uniref:low-density lipoprotein receptor-related protein 4-like n=1 Tax=Haliotis rubra TaxID=36100 RepID=UPI001EE60917|nr:low-density lipoprotein receptor-related protein 4-like [Haliotis rubra]
MYSLRGWCLVAVVCAVSGTEDVMVFVTDKSNEVSGQIHRVNVTSRVVSTLPLFKVIRPVAIGYDSLTENIYWSDVMSKEIRSAKFDGTKESTLLDLDTHAVPDGLTIDMNHRKLFYTDAGNHIIWGVDLDGRQANEEIINENLENPRAIITYSSKKLLIWTDWAVFAKIERCNFDGTDRKILVNTDIQWPNGITLDDQSETLYWCDAGEHRIDSVKLDGTGRRQILNEPGTHYFGIFFFEDALYFTDWKTNAVRAIHLNGTEKLRISSGGFKSLTGIYVTKLSRCSSHTYGESCEEQCGHCKDGVACNRTTGLCTEGCQANYYGITGSRGYNFSMCNRSCGHCKADSCHYLSGECPYGCKTGWSGPKCDTEIIVTTETSSLSTDTSTDPLTDTTRGPAQIGNGSTTCGKMGNYGDGCKYKCGACANHAHCNSQTGECPQHCACGWEGSQCNHRLVDNRDCTQVLPETRNLSAEASHSIDYAVPVMIAVIVALVIVIAVLVVLIFRSRRAKESQYNNLQFNSDTGASSINDENVEYNVVSEVQCQQQTEANASSQLHPQPDVLPASDKCCDAISDDVVEDAETDMNNDSGYAALDFVNRKE